MQERGIVHPRLMQMLTPNVYPSLCTIELPNASIDSHGDESSAPTPITGLTDIPCRIAPAQTTESRGGQMVYVEGLYQVDLAGYYPQIDSDSSVVIDGKAWAMEGQPQSDGQHSMTRFNVREVA